MRNSDYEVRLTSYDEEKCHVITSVKIESDNFETFTKIVEAATPILKAEDITKEEKYQEVNG